MAKTTSKVISSDVAGMTAGAARSRATVRPSADRADKRGTLAAATALALFPFVQLGMGYYLSTATVVVLLLCWAFLASLLRAGLQIQSYFLIVPFMLLGIAWGGQASDVSNDLLRVVREAIFFILTLAALRTGTVGSIHLDAKKFVRVALIVVVATSVLTMIQMYYIPRGIFVSFPRDWYVANAATIPDALDLKYSKVRPSATFGEPSYLGFFLFSIIVMLLPLLEKSHRVRHIAGLAVFCGMLSQSVSFVASIFILAVVWVLLSGMHSRRKIVIILGVAIAAFGALLLIDGLLDRFLRVGSGADASAQFRLVMPLFLLPSYLAQYPVGQPFSELPIVLSPMAARMGMGFASPLDNAMANLVFVYGLPALIMIGILVVSARHAILRTYIVLAMFYNGNIFSIDKCAMILLVTVVFRAMCLSGAAVSRMPIRNPSSSVRPDRREGRIMARVR